MRRRAALALIVLATAARGLAAQTPSEPRLFLSLLAGYRANRALWSLSNQPYPVLVPNGDTTVLSGANLYDTLNLERRLTPGFVLGVSATYFPGPHVGFQGEFAFLGMDLESRCSIRQSQPPYPTDVNPALCQDLDHQNSGGSAVGLSLGLVGRATPGKGVFPFARASAGFVARDRGTIQMLGGYFNGADVSTVAVVDERNPVKTTAQFTFGVGVAVATGRGYQLWLEGRDVIAMLDHVTGPADPTDPSGSLFPPHGSKFFHNFVLAMGLDVIFEQRRGHRY